MYANKYLLTRNGYMKPPLVNKYLRMIVYKLLLFGVLKP